MLELVRHTCKYGRVLVITEYDKYNNAQVQGVALLQPPYHDKVCQFYKRVKTHKKQLVFSLGLKVFMRMLAQFEKDDLELAKQKKNVQAWVLHALAVRPEAQCKGLGGALISSFIKMVDEQHLSCLMATRDVRNLSLFKRYGFNVVNKQELVNAKTSPTWIMKRTGDVFVHSN